MIGKPVNVIHVSREGKIGKFATPLTLNIP